MRSMCFELDWVSVCQVLQFYSNRVLNLCSECTRERGRGVDEDAVNAKLSIETQKVVASYIVRREGDEMPWLEGKHACWPGSFSY